MIIALKNFSPVNTWQVGSESAYFHTRVYSYISVCWSWHTHTTPPASPTWGYHNDEIVTHKTYGHLLGLADNDDEDETGIISSWLESNGILIWQKKGGSITYDPPILEEDGGSLANYRHRIYYHEGITAYTVTQVTQTWRIWKQEVWLTWEEISAGNYYIKYYTEEY